MNIAQILTINPRTTAALVLFLTTITATVTAIAGNPRTYWQTNQGNRITSVKVSDAGTYVATGEYGGTATARLYNAKTGTLLDEYPGHQNGVVSVDISPDETMLAVGHIRVDFYHGIAQTNVYDIQTKELLYEFGGTIAQFSADGSRIACAGGGFNRYVGVYDLPSGNQVASIYTGDYIWDMEFAPDGNSVATCAGKSNVAIWDANTAQEITRLSHGSAALGTLAFSDDGTMLAAGVVDQGQTARIKVWDTTTEKLLQDLPGHEDGVIYALTFSPNNQTLLSTGNDVPPPNGNHTLRLWNINTGNQVTKIPFAQPSFGIRAADFAPNGKAAVIGLGNGTVIAAGSN